MEATPNPFVLPAGAFFKVPEGGSGTQAQRCPGRPKKRTEDYYEQLLRQHCDLVRWYADAFGRPPKGDVELLTKHFVAECLRVGARPGRVNSEEIQGRIKTLRNRLSEARRVVRGLSQKPPISGTTSRAQ